MTQDDRMETITDPAQIRAVWEAGDMGEESLGGDSESGTYNRSNRPPAGPRPDADNPWALLPDDHPERPKQCGGCGTKWVDAETARACERRHGDDITTPAPVGAAVALDLDAIEARANAATEGTWRADSHSHIQNGCRCLSCYDDPTVYQLSVFLDCEDVPRWDDDATRCTQSGFQTWADADFAAHAREDVPALVAEVRRLTVEAATQREWFEAADAAADRRLDQSIAWMERAEAAEAEVRRLTESRATVAANLSASLMLADAEVGTLRARLARSRSRYCGCGWCCSNNADGVVPGDAHLSCSRYAALAVTTGEGQ